MILNSNSKISKNTQWHSLSRKETAELLLMFSKLLGINLGRWPADNNMMLTGRTVFLLSAVLLGKVYFPFYGF